MNGWQTLLKENGPTLPVLVGLLLGAAVLLQAKLTMVLVVGVLVVLVGLARPVVLIGMMFGSMLLDRIGLTGMKLGDFPITLSKLSVLAAIGLWVVHAVLNKVTIIRWHPIQTAMLSVAGATAASIAYHNCLNTGKFTLYGLLMMTVLVTVTFSALSKTDLRPLYRFLAMGLCAALLVSLRSGGGTAAPGEVARVSGTMGDPNEWATLVLLVSPFILGGLTEDKTSLGAGLRWALFLLTPVGILRSESRTALVVGVLVTPGVLYLLRRHQTALWVSGAAALVAAPLLIDLEKMLYRFNQLIRNLRGGAAVPDPSLEERSELLRQGKQLFLDHFIVGAGPGNYPYATGFISHEGHFRPAHNTYLELASEQGLVGLIPVGIFLLLIFNTLQYGFRSAPTLEHRHRILGAGLGLGAFGLMAATLNLLTFAMGYLMLGCTLAVVYQARQEHVH